MTEDISISAADFLTVQGVDFRIDPTPPLAEQKFLVDSVGGLRILLQAIFNTWRLNLDFTISFSGPDGATGPIVTFVVPKGHRDWVAEVIEAHR